MPRSRYMAFLAVTLLVPVVLLLLLEGALRLVMPGTPLFVPAPFAGPGYRVANQEVARRYFPQDRFPPAPAAEPFAARRPEGGLRIFVLGESSAAGFPLPHNGTFSRVLRDALTDVLPDVPVEVVNLGIAATNSYTFLDLMREVLEQRPDLVLVYSGHNEYYGALGVGSSRGGMAPPAIKRAMLRLLHLRTAQLVRSGVLALVGWGRGDGGGPAASPVDAAAATMMEVVARDRQIALGSDVYGAGLRQFESNLSRLVDMCRRAGVEVFIASQASNVRDQAPFVSPVNGAPGGADSMFAMGRSALAAGDSAAAREQLLRARDMDVIRFRAPSELNAIVRRVADRGAHYVPVSERFDAESSGMPGAELFYEHVHPRPAGQVLIARTFFEAIRDAGFGGHAARLDRLQPWDSYERRMALTDFDLRVADHTVATLGSRWPFVSQEEQSDYRGSYRPTGLADSLALVVSRGGIPWGAAKLRLAEVQEELGRPDSAAAEYLGLVRDAPFAELPHRLLGRARLMQGDSAAATAELSRAFEIEPGSYTSMQLGRLAMARGDLKGAVRYLEEAVRLAPADPVAIYSLSLAYGMARDLPRARVMADRLATLAPGFPGLAEWRQTIGIRP